MQTSFPLAAVLDGESGTGSRTRKNDLMHWTRAELKANGYQGFVPFARLGDIPDEPGVYIVIRTDPQIPIFNAFSTANKERQTFGAVSIDLLKDHGFRIGPWSISERLAVPTTRLP